ncbi:SDR family oxidoreductase [Microbacterium sp. STN6]|uniref:SDR family oxidoreductase n=1 Tax=Microbacterium sp. STN6 TaxID=2995588 RepID=UPI002260B52C|nr:SDR family oxidoreductase [Microbacterium sp. STN6]MCX7521274.1 SDR family oxidoreductase [Microbacterium sp. STN6]
MIVITGATGQLGSQVVEQLLRHVPAEHVGVSVRNTEKARDLADRGVRVRRGDFNDADSLASAFEGAKRVLIVSSNSSGREAVAQHAMAIDAARDAGAERVLYTSHQGVSAQSEFAPMLDHAATTAYLSTLGTPFTTLRNGFYASTVPLLLGQALQTGEIVAPADGPVSWTTHADLAEADAAILADPSLLGDGETPPLTARDAHDLDDIARMLTELTGRSIRRVVVEDEEWVLSLIGHGVPVAQARLLLGMFLGSRNGEFAVTDPALEQVLGRPAQPISTVLGDLVSGSRAA